MLFLKKYLTDTWTRLLFILFLLAVFLITWNKNSSFDFYFYIAAVEHFFSNFSLPTHDPFLFSIPNDKWLILHEWASMLSYYLSFSLGGELGAQTLKLGVVCAIILMFLTNSKKSPGLTYIILIYTLILIQFRITLRGSLFAYLFFSYAIIFFHKIKKDKSIQLNHYVAYALLACLWTNFHPSFVLIFLPPFLLVENYKRLGKLIPFCATAFTGALLNPKMLMAYEYPLRSFFEQGWEVYKQYNLEWFSLFNEKVLHYHEPYLYLFITLLAFITLLKSKAGLGKWIILVASFYLSVNAVRLVPYSAIFCTYLLLTEDKALFLPHKKLKSIAGFFLCAAIFKMSLYGHQNLSGKVEFGHGKRAETYPDEAIKILNGFPSEKLRVFNQHKFGSYLAYRWAGNPKVYFHGFVNDFEFYKRDYISVNQSLRDFERVNHKHGINAYLLSHYNASKNHGPLLYQFLHRSDEWKLIYRDPQSILFIHESFL